MERLCGPVCVCVYHSLRHIETSQWNQLSPVWSTTATVKLFFAFLHLLPRPAGSRGSSAARSSTLTLHSDVSGTAAPTVAPGTSRLSCFHLLKERGCFTHTCCAHAEAEQESKSKTSFLPFAIVQLTSLERPTSQFGEKIVELAKLFVNCRSIVSPFKHRQITGPEVNNEVQDLVCDYCWYKQ